MKIVAAAIRTNKLTISLPSPMRHSDILREVFELNQDAATSCEQGFLTDTGDFVDRIRAKLIVRTAGQQTIANTHPYALFSEDLW